MTPNAQHETCLRIHTNTVEKTTALEKRKLQVGVGNSFYSSLWAVTYSRWNFRHSCDNRKGRPPELVICVSLYSRPSFKGYGLGELPELKPCFRTTVVPHANVIEGFNSSPP